MTTETHNIIELPYGNQVPTQHDIIQRFRKLYLEDKPLLPLLTSCAEEAERMMHELFIDAQTHSVTVKTHHKRESTYIKTIGYLCPSCKNDLHLKFSYCPGCGKPIEWIYKTGRKNNRAA